MKKKRFLSDSDAHYVVKDAEKNPCAGQTSFTPTGTDAWGIMMLTGCDISNNDDIEKHCSVYPDLMTGFKVFCSKTVWHQNIFQRTLPLHSFNAFYGEEEIPVIDGRDYKLEIRGWYVITVTGFV